MTDKVWIFSLCYRTRVCPPADFSIVTTWQIPNGVDTAARPTRNEQTNTGCFGLFWKNTLTFPHFAMRNSFCGTRHFCEPRLTQTPILRNSIDTCKCSILFHPIKPRLQIHSLLLDGPLFYQFKCLERPRNTSTRVLLCEILIRKGLFSKTEIHIFMETPQPCSYPLSEFRIGHCHD